MSRKNKLYYISPCRIEVKTGKDGECSYIPDRRAAPQTFSIVIRDYPLHDPAMGQFAVTGGLRGGEGKEQGRMF